MTLPSGLRRDLAFVLLAVALVTLYVARSGGGFPLDDSWIHQVYGRNLAERGEWAFIPGQPSAASTSPLYTVLLAIGYRLGVEYGLWAHLLGALALAASGMLAARLTLHVLPQRRRLDIVVGLAVVLTWHLIWAAASGMETMLFAALTLALIHRAWCEREPHNHLLPALTARHALLRGVVFGVLAALAALARPEGIGLAGLAGLALLVWRPVGLPAWIAGASLAFAVTIAPYLLLNLQLTGGLLPNTAAAKWAQHAPLLALSYPTRAVNMTIPILVGGQVMLLPGLFVYLAYILRHSPRRRWLLDALPLLWVAALIALYAARLPASYQHGRYVIPALPALVTVGALGTLLLLQQARASLIGRAVARALAFSAALLLVFFALITGAEAYERDVRVINEEMVATAHWIREHLPPSDLLAIHDIGAVGYFAPRPLVDIAGLVSPDVVPLIGDAEGLWAYMRDSGARYLMAFPDQIPGRSTADRRLCLVYSTNAPTAPALGAANMAVYQLAWDNGCLDSQ